MIKNDHYLEDTILNKLSIVIGLIDDFTGVEPIGDIKVSLEGIQKNLMINGSGYYFFTDLKKEIKQANVIVESDFYFYEVVPIDLSTNESFVSLIITLKPNSAYPFPNGTTLIRGVIKDTAGHPISGVKVKADVFQPTSTTTAVARIGHGDAEAGDPTIGLVNLSSNLPIKVGDRLMIKDSNNEKIEFCKIQGLPQNPVLEPFKLDNPLKFQHSSGTPLYHMEVDNILETITNEKGDMALYSKKFKTRKFITSLTFSYPNYKVVTQENEIMEGSVTSLKMIYLPPL